MSRQTVPQLQAVLNSLREKLARERNPRMAAELKIQIADTEEELATLRAYERKED
jgi:uncharacterized protein (DUF2267 family)